MPTSTEDVSPALGVDGVAAPSSEHGQVTFTPTPADGVSRLPLSSTARVRIVVAGLPCAFHVYVQLDVPLAGCHVAPPSVETSTPATTPPPVSVAVPEIVVGVPSAMTAPAEGEEIEDVGAEASVDAVVAVRPAMSVAGCACMSASRLTVACCMTGSGGWLGGPCRDHAFVVSRPHAHCTVPAPKTSAPLGARYSVRLWVTGGLGDTVVLPKSLNVSVPLTVV